MKYLRIDDIKQQLRLDFDCEDALLELYGTGAEDTILHLCNRTYENLVETYGEVPAAIRHATLLLVANSYEQRSPASPTNLSAVHYNFDMLVKPYMVLSGTAMMNERNRIIDILQEQNTNIGFFAAADDSETKRELTERISTMWKKYTAVSEPTPMILENMRQEAKKLTDDVKAGRLLYTQLSGGEENIADLMLSVDRRQQFSDMYAFRRLTIGMFLALIPFLILIAVYLHRRIEEGELGVTVPMHGSDELGRLGETFSHMSLRLKEQIDKTYKEEIELKNAQILALQSRINPHFINNALEDINWQARMEGSESISSMVTSLSVLLNATMARQDRRLVTLREEMEVAEAYIYFIQQRFGTDLTMNREIEEKALDGILPLLTIQPLLENAVEHGIAPAGGGTITIRCSLNDACMHIEIINTGRETGREDRERIEAALHGQPTGKHLGLANIVNRLRLIYGESVEIRVDTDTPGQTTVSIVIPREIP